MIDPQRLQEYHAALNELYRSPWYKLPFRFWRSVGAITALLDDLIDESLGLDKPTGRAMAPRQAPIDLDETMARHAQIHDMMTGERRSFFQRTSRRAFDFCYPTTASRIYAY